MKTVSSFKNTWLSILLVAGHTALLLWVVDAMIASDDGTFWKIIEIIDWPTANFVGKPLFFPVSAALPLLFLGGFQWLVIGMVLQRMLNGAKLIAKRAEFNRSEQSLFVGGLMVIFLICCFVVINRIVIIEKRSEVDAHIAADAEDFVRRQFTEVGPDSEARRRLGAFKSLHGTAFRRLRGPYTDRLIF